MLHLFLADGFEEIEALATLDILRRCGLEVQTISISGAHTVHGAHGIPVYADAVFRQSELMESQCFILPGGMPGAQNLLDSSGLHKALITQYERGALIAAICAAPMVLGQHGLLKEHAATCYPGFEEYLEGADVQDNMVVESANIITGRGPAAAKDFAFAIAARFITPKQIKEVKKGMLLI